MPPIAAMVAATNSGSIRLFHSTCAYSERDIHAILYSKRSAECRKRRDAELRLVDCDGSGRDYLIRGHVELSYCLN
jgi:hypothetical protein